MNAWQSGGILSHSSMSMVPERKVRSSSGGLASCAYKNAFWKTWYADIFASGVVGIGGFECSQGVGSWLSGFLYELALW